MAPDHPRTWIKIAARTGYAARGAVYVIVGALTVLAGFVSSKKPDTRDAVSTLMHQPFGVVLVCALLAGLCCYVIWRLLQVIFDPDEHGSGAKGLIIRAAFLVSATSYAFLALYALSLLGIGLAEGGGGGGSPLREYLTSFLGARTVALALAITFAGVAIAHWRKAFAGTYEKYFKADDDAESIIRPIAVIGLSARGLVFAVIAWLFASRFIYLGEQQATEKPGLQDVLNYLAKLPYGPWLTIAMGVGLIAYALYSLAEARWRRIGRL
ncbi:DUF1206 domain-containing protein [Rhizobium sp. L1K21]|uniref:DUF1206 domain-containing protein n=1 Tax=Rhizobium sp. L1K21 TaxID=2954933 RepID=UPI00209377EA|nr:DUF1206 domain-containing protein [Rhizobium sp. L1K21]MCO6188330.1 DUF1206 domain-containing protein [Rhizobium sp. L1K21]